VRNFIVLMVLILSGCAAKPDFDTLVKFNKQIELENLYVYSFIDFREKIIGSSVISDMKKQFDLQFEQRGVEINQLWYKESIMLTNTSVSEKSGETNLPVGQIIKANLINEQKVNAKYRLVAFPSYVSHGNSNVGYQIKWTLSDVNTNEIIWVASSWTNNMNWLSSNEMSEARAKVFVQGLIKQLQNGGALKKVTHKG